jgi:protein phosphatase
VLLKIPERSLVLLIGAGGSGKSTFARKHFKSTEIVSSDALRGVVSDDEGDQTASGDAFQLLRMITLMRLRRGRLTVIDATSVQPAARKSLLALAGRTSRPAVAIVFNLPAAVCVARNQARVSRPVSSEIVEKQVADLLNSLAMLPNEGLSTVYVLENTADIDSAEVLRELPNT